ncbi:MAG: hypothetical protein M1834_001629 [Cirrosporium novae-zelandiae]|nr:MAG: hypothetical protein M1834_004146 [Cirrosporium novae-zelandiae]KAI9735613.1 MAG: hypothetical protein M1834_001629 [Cirrosporium novae-zelandiae]
MNQTTDEQDFWLFGYGSLIWKPPPHYDQRIPGYIEGPGKFASPLTTPLAISPKAYAVCSEDHRGTPEAPGRVVTLIERSFWDTLGDKYHAADKQVWGTAYHIIPAKVKEVREYLDIREINGYSIQYTKFYPAENGKVPIHCLVYIGLPSNPQFVGVQEPQALAEWIYQSIGPSGPNKDYLLMLEESLVHLSRESGDGHISDLATRVKRLETERGVDDGAIQPHVIGSELRKVGSTEEQEEIEKDL